MTKGKRIGYEVNISIFTDLSPEEVDATFDRIMDAVCGEDHSPDDECPIGDWVGSVGPMYEEE